MKRTGIHHSRGIVKKNQSSDYVYCPDKKELTKSDLQEEIELGMKEYNDKFRGK